MAKEQPRRFDHVRGQRLLARVAAGLNFFGKMLAAPEVQRAAFLYAAHNLKSFLKLFGLRWLPDGVGNILMPA